MLNKKEIEYNATALTSTWLGDEKKITNLRLIFNNDTANAIVPCSAETVGKELSKVLCDNKKSYTNVKLLGSVKGEDKMFGELDII